MHSKPPDSRWQRLNVSAAAITYQQLTLFFIIAMTIAGVFAYTKLGQREDPDFVFRAMTVRTLWPGATTSQIDLQITDRLEKKLQEMPYFKRTQSYSKPGESMIILELLDTAPRKEVANLWYQVRKKVADVRQNLPPESIGPFFNDEFGDVFGSIYAFTGDGFSLSELRDQVEAVRQELLRIPDVAKIELVGVLDDKIYIEMATTRLASLGIDPQSIAQQLQAQNIISATGTIQTQDHALALRVDGGLDSVDSVRTLRLVVNGRTVQLGDIATVYRGYVDPPIQAIRFGGKPAILLTVAMKGDGDVLRLGSSLNTSLQRIKHDLPVGIDFHQVSDQPKVVDEAVGTFMRSLLEAVSIVLVVSLFALGWRAGAVVALTIPFVLLVTFLLMYMLKIDLHRISTGALIIALGLLVDDAMIVVEMMVRKLDEGLDNLAAASFAYATTAWPMLSGTLVTAAGFLPIATAKSATGEYTFEMFSVTTIALVVSWVAAIIVTPLFGYWLLKSKTALAPHLAHHEHFNTPFYNRLRALIDGCIRYRWRTIAVTLLALALGIVGMGLTEKQFFPTSDRTEVMVEMWLPEGSSFKATEAQVARLEALIQSNPDVKTYVTSVGMSLPRYFLSLNQELFRPNFSHTLILTSSVAARDRVALHVQQALDTAFPGVRARAIKTPLGPPVAYPVIFRVSGPDIQVLKRIGDEVATVMRRHPHTVEVNADWGDRSPALSIVLNQDRMRALGVTTAAVSHTLSGAVTGNAIGQYRERDRLIEVVLRQPAKERAAIARVADIQVPTTFGHSVPLAQIAEVKAVMEEPIIRRYSRVPTLSVRSDITEGIQAPDVSAQIDPQLNTIRAQLPPGYRVDIGGAYEENVAAQASINAGFPLMLLVWLGLLMLQLKNFSMATMVLITAPFGVVGVAIGLLAFRMPFGFVAMLGVIALMGIIMRNTIILIDQVRQDLHAGVSAWIAVREAAVRRFRPITLTAVAAILAMIPLTRSVLWGPMAVAIMAGLIVATVLTILAVPAIYAAWYRLRPPAVVSA